MSWQVIGNPVAGGGAASGAIAALEKALRGRGLDVQTLLTRAPGDAQRCAANLAPGVQGVVVVGGDGTLNEVLNGLPDPGRLPLAQLPFGTANILAHDLNLPRHPETVAEMLQRGKVRRLDMGTSRLLPPAGAFVDPAAAIPGSPGATPVATGAPTPQPPRRFLMLLSAGFDALVARDIHSHRRGTLGYLGYVMPILRSLGEYRAPRLKVTVADAPIASPPAATPEPARTVEGAMVVVSNTRNYGGLFSITDRAACDSGRLDVCVLTRGSVLALMSYAWSARAASLSGRSDVIYLTGTHVRIDGPDLAPVEVDGDYVGTTPVEIDLTPGCVPFVVP